MLPMCAACWSIWGGGPNQPDWDGDTPRSCCCCAKDNLVLYELLVQVSEEYANIIPKKHVKELVLEPPNKDNLKAFDDIQMELDDDGEM
jgi:hypothetical protein